MSSNPAVILSYARTPMGSFQGSLAPASAIDLGAAAVAAAVERSGVKHDDIERCYMGCVLAAGLGQAPARQAERFGGLSDHVESTTINKMCGSGMKAKMMAADALAAGSADLIVAGGMESMSNAPYLQMKHRTGARIGHDTVYDHMMLDGLEDAYEPSRAMGTFAEDAAREYQFSRSSQDNYAIKSLTRAQHAQRHGAFDKEIAGVSITTRKGTATVVLDEQPAKGDIAKVPTLKPAFAKNGTKTAATASSISDGAAAFVLSSLSFAESAGSTPIARVVAQCGHAGLPARFAMGPAGAVAKLFLKTGWSVADVDLFEINEAFACVAMIAMQDIGIPHEKMNIHGGATAMGHPIGASGARILVTLLAALERTGGRRGIASLCIGGGEATAIAIEMLA